MERPKNIGNIALCLKRLIFTNKQTKKTNRKQKTKAKNAWSMANTAEAKNIAKSQVLNTTCVACATEEKIR